MFKRKDTKVEETNVPPDEKSQDKQTPEITAQVPRKEISPGGDFRQSIPASQGQHDHFTLGVNGRHDPPASASQGEREGHVLIGEGVKIKGEIRDCRLIEIHGTVEGDLEAEVLVVKEKGLLKGNIKTDMAEVHGSIDGDVSVKNLLDVRAKGSVAGKTEYGELSVHTGGRLVGTLDDQHAKKNEPTNVTSQKASNRPDLAETKSTKSRPTDSEPAAA